MELREQFIKLLERRGIKIEKIRGGGKVIYRVNGSLLYITFSKNLGTEQEEKYFLQVNKKKLMRSLGQEEELFILLICGDTNNIFVIPAGDFLEMVKDYQVAADGNWKINIAGKREVVKVEEDYEIKLGKCEYPISNYKNKFELIKAKRETVKKFISMIQDLQEGRLKEAAEKPKTVAEVTYKVELLGFKKGIDLDYEKLIELSQSGEGKQFEKVVLLCFKYLGFEIDEKTSGKPGELDIICLSPIKIGIECRSTERSVGVNIIDELKRHLRRYEERNNYEKNSFKGLIICEDTTNQFNKDSVTEKIFSMKVSTLAKLIKFSMTHPVSPYEFGNFFINYGSVDDVTLQFIKEKEKKIKLRKDVMSILIQKARPLNYYEIRTFLEGQNWKIEEIEAELNNVLIELSSPLINAIRMTDDKYECIKSPEVEDKSLLLSLKKILE